MVGSAAAPSRPSPRSSTIRAPGIVTEIFVREGQMVDKGATLLRLDDTRFKSNKGESEADRYALTAQVERLSAEAEGRPLVLSEEVRAKAPQVAEDELSLYDSRQRRLASEKQTLNEQFPSLRTRVSRLENGPPVGYPIQFRVSGEHIDEVRGLARQVADKVRENPHVSNMHLDWQEPSKVVYLNVDQERARALGVTTADLSRFLQSAVSGSSVSQYREDDELIEILLRGTEQERHELGGLASLSIPTENGSSVALSQVATLEYGFEEGIRSGRASCRERV